MIDANVDRGGKTGERSGFQTRDLIRFFIVDIILIIITKLLLGLFFFTNPDSYVFAILGSKVVLLLYLVWLIRDRRDAWPETGATTLGRWWGWPAAFLIYAASYPLLFLIDQLNLDLLAKLYAWLGWPFVPRIQDAIILIFDKIIDTPARLALVFFTVFVGPFMEELAFRGLGLDAYRRRHGLFWAVFWTSLLFGLYHFNDQILVPLSVTGAIFCFARVLSGSLWCAVAVHCFHNFLALALVARQLGIIDFPWYR